MLTSRECLGIDIDDDALEICSTNCQEFEIDNVDRLRADLTYNIFRDKMVDTVIMNPPFGTKHNQGKRRNLRNLSLSF